MGIPLLPTLFNWNPSHCSSHSGFSAAWARVIYFTFANKKAVALLGDQAQYWYGLTRYWWWWWSSQFVNMDHPCGGRVWVDCVKAPHKMSSKSHGTATGWVSKVIRTSCNVRHRIMIWQIQKHTQTPVVVEYISNHSPSSRVKWTEVEWSNVRHNTATVSLHRG